MDARISRGDPAPILIAKNYSNPSRYWQMTGRWTVDADQPSPAATRAWSPRTAIRGPFPGIRP